LVHKNRTSVRATTPRSELLVALERGSGAMHGQIERALREAIRSGRLRHGGAVPSTRVLAGDLGVSRGVVVEAYDQLIAEGFLLSRPGSRTVVAAQVAAAHASEPDRAALRIRYDFRPGVPDLTRFPRDAWLRATRKVVRGVSARELSYGDPRGALELRTALADYLGRVRHVDAESGTVIICNGFAHALAILARVLLRRGIRRIAIEDPGHPGPRQLLRAAGLEPIAVPVDDRGLDVAALAATTAGAVLVTPAHQSPSGVVLAPDRRQQLIAWSERPGRLIIEDDYDAEYRYDRAPVGALQALAPKRVVYAGSASKILAPGLRLGWLVAPRELAEPIAADKLDLGAPIFEQLIYAELLAHGEIDRHLRRMRVLYRRRRDVLIVALARHLPAWQPRGIAAGLHLVVRLPANLDERDVVAVAASRSIRLYAMADYRHRHTRRARGELVLGYAGLTEVQLRDGIAELAAALLGSSAGASRSTAARRR
jgi:GntR family transcriptional regulator/MocR family aminotransferase